MIWFNRLVKKSVSHFGFRLTRINDAPINASTDAYEDMQRLLKNKSNPLIFDIGANTGQTIHKLKECFKDSKIHSFEPSPSTFKELEKNYRNTKNVYLNNLAVGSEVGKGELLENEYSDMSSFLEIGSTGWGTIQSKTMVDVVTIDYYCEKNDISKVDIIKSDTQGFEYEVFKGALKMMKSNNIQLLYFEVIFSDQYKNMPTFSEIYNLMHDNNFKLVKFYDYHFQNNLLSWTDALFVNFDY